MLSKIFNISAGSDYRNSNSKLPLRFLSYGREDNSDIHDSLNFSPALMLITHLKWRINSIKCESDKINLDFFINDFTFITSIQLYNDNSFITYRVKKEEEIKNIRRIIHLNLSVKTNKEIPDKVEPIELNHLQLLFDKIISQDFTSGNITDERDIAEIISGLRNGLENELDLLNAYIVHFIERYTSSKIITSESEDNLPNFILKSISIKTN